jgi:phage tail protein X
VGSGPVHLCLLTPAYTVSYTYSYEGHDSWLEKSVGGTSTDATFNATTSASSYDAFGREIAVTETTKTDNNSAHDYLGQRYLAFDATGGVVLRRDGYLKNGTTFTQAEEVGGAKLANPTQWIDNTTWLSYASPSTVRINTVINFKTKRAVYVNGQMIGQVDQAGGKLDVISRLTAYSNSDTGSKDEVVQQGDTLQSIAQRVYGNSTLWYVIATANALDASSTLVAGTRVKVPEVQTTKNDASTFKPYDPSQITGNSVGYAYIPPPPKPNCIKIAIMVIIAVIVTVYTAGAAAQMMGVLATSTGATGTMAIGAAALTGGGAGLVTAFGAAGAAATLASGAVIAGAAAVGGFMGSVASQVVGKALGVVDHFSLRSAVGSGIASGLTAGIGGSLGTVGQAIGESNWAKAAGIAVANATTSYIGNRIAGVADTSFSWKSIAAQSLANFGVAAMDHAFKWDDIQTYGGSGNLGQDLVNTFAGGVASVEFGKALGTDDHFNLANLVGNAFGTAIGNGLVRTFQGEDFLGIEEKPPALAAQSPGMSKALADLQAKLDKHFEDEIQAKLDSHAKDFVDGVIGEPNSDRISDESGASADASPSSTSTPTNTGNPIFISDPQARNISRKDYGEYSPYGTGSGADSVSTDYPVEAQGIGMSLMDWNFYVAANDEHAIYKKIESRISAFDKLDASFTGDVEYINYSPVPSANVSTIAEVMAARNGEFLNFPEGHGMGRLNWELGTNILPEYLSSFEGGQRLDVYLPIRKGKIVMRSGPTAGTGVDIGQMSESQIRALGLSDSLTQKLIPYANRHNDPQDPLSGPALIKWFAGNRITLTKPEADELDYVVQGIHLRAAIASWDSARPEGSPSFTELSPQQQTVILSRTYQAGTGMPKTKLWKAFYGQALKGDWNAAAKLLYSAPVRDFSYQYRVRREASLLGYPR